MFRTAKTVSRASFRVPQFAVVVWGCACGIAAILRPSVLHLPLLVLFLVVIGVCIMGNTVTHATYLPRCAFVSTFLSVAITSVDIVFQNAYVAPFRNDFVGMHDWWGATDRREVAVYTLQAMFTFSTVYTSRYVQGGWSDEAALAEGAAAAVTGTMTTFATKRSKLQAAIDFLKSAAVRYRSTWLLPLFALVAVTGPSVLSLVLILVVFVGCVSPSLFRRLELGLYFFACAMSLAVYAVNVFQDFNIPIIVRILVGDPNKDGAVLPLLAQCTVSGFIALSWVLDERAKSGLDNDLNAATMKAKLQSTSKQLGGFMSEAVLQECREEWERLGNPRALSREQARQLTNRLLAGGHEATPAATAAATTQVPYLDEDHFALAWGALMGMVVVAAEDFPLRHNAASPASGAAALRGFIKPAARHAPASQAGGDSAYFVSEMNDLAQPLVAADEAATEEEGGASTTHVDAAGAPSAADESPPPPGTRRHAATVVVRPSAQTASLDYHLATSTSLSSSMSAAAPQPPPRARRSFATDVDELDFSGYVTLRSTIHLHFLQHESAFHTVRLVAKQLFFENTRSLALLLGFAAATHLRAFDVIHLVLLGFFAVFGAFRRLGERFWIVFIAYAIFTAAVVFTTLVVADVLPGSDTAAAQTLEIVGFIPPPTKWDVLWYVALVFAAAAERGVVMNRRATFRQVLVGLDIERLSAHPLLARVKCLTALVAVVVVIAFRIVFETHSLMMVGYACFLFLVALLALHDTWYTKMQNVFLVGVCYAVVSLLALSITQFPQVRTSAASVLRYPDGTCKFICLVDIGLSKDDGSTMALFLLSSFATLTAMAVAYVTFADYGHHFSTPLSDVSLKGLFPVARRGVRTILAVADDVSWMLRREGHHFVYAAMCVAMVNDQRVVSLLYCALFIADAPSTLVMIASMVHMLIALVFHCSWVPKDRLNMMAYVGIAGVPPDFNHAVLGPVLVFVTSLAQIRATRVRDASSDASKRADAVQGDSAVNPASFRELNVYSPTVEEQRVVRKSRLRRALDVILIAPTELSYELLLLVHIAGCAVCIKRAPGAVHALLCTMLMHIGREKTLTSRTFLTVSSVVNSVFMIASLLLRVGVPDAYKSAFPAQLAAPTDDWVLWSGVRGPGVDVVFFFLGVVFSRLCLSRHGFWHGYFSLMHARIGFGTIQSLLRDRAGLVRELRLAIRRTADGVLPSLDDLPKCSKTRQWLIRGFCMTVPTGVLTFFEGAGDVSVLNLFIIVSGLLMLSHQQRLQWESATLWPKWEKFSNFFQFIVVVLNLPPVAEAIYGRSQLLALGITDGQGPIGISFLRVMLMWSVFVQRRVFEEPYFAEILRAMHSAKLTEKERHVALKESLADVAKEELQIAQTRMEERRRKLDEIRKARELGATAITTDYRKVADLDIHEDDDDGGGKEQTASSNGSGAAAAQDHNNRALNGEDRPDEHRPIVVVCRVVAVRRNDDDDDANSDRSNDAEDSDRDGEVQGAHRRATRSDTTGASATEETKAATTAEEEEKSNKPSLVARAREKCDALAMRIATIAHCVPAVEILRKPEARLFRACVGILDRFSAEMCFILFSANFVMSGSVFDALLAVVSLTYGVILSPWPPAQYWTACQVYTVVGIILKSFIALWHKATPFAVSSRRYIAVLLLPLPEDRSGSILSELLGDFLIFAAVLLHQQACRRQAIYAGEEVKRSLLDNVQSRTSVGVDLYALMLLLDLIAFTIGVTNFFTIAGMSTGSFVASIKSDLLPGTLVVSMFVSVIFIVIDRVIYKTANAKAKFGFHVFLVLGFHAAFVAWRRMPKVSSSAGVAYFCFKLMYLMTSSVQIRKGFPMFPDHDPFSARPRFPFSTAYQVYRAIPFVFEMRALLDWSCTPTTLSFPYWLKLEDIRHFVYLRYVEKGLRAVTNPQPGMPFPVAKKLQQGAIIFAILLVILFFPLFFYSTFNPSLVPNRVLSATATVQFGRGTPFYQAEARTVEEADGDNVSTALARTRPVLASHDITNDEKTTQVIAFPNCSSVPWPVTPSALRTLSEAIVVALLANSSETSSSGQGDPAEAKSAPTSNSPLAVVGAFSITRYGTSGTARLTQMIQFYHILNRASLLQLALFLNGSTRSAELRTHALYTPFVANTPPLVTFVAGLPLGDQLNCSLNFELERDPVTQILERHVCMSCSPLFNCGLYPQPECGNEFGCVELGNCGDDGPPDYERSPPTNTTTLPLYMAAISDKVPSSSGFLPNIGIIALYTTFILAIGQVLRGSMSGSAIRIALEDMEDPHRVRDLLDLIELTRMERRPEDFKLEEAMYFELLDLLRSSEALIGATGFRAVKSA